MFLIEAILIGSGFLAVSIIVSVNVVLRSKKRTRCMEKFVDYQAILEYFMERAFDTIYKDRVFTFSLEGTRPPEGEVTAISHDFVRLTQKLLGPMMLEELIFMYGGEEAFTFNILNYFNTKYEEDEIRKSALDQFTSQQDEE